MTDRPIPRPDVGILNVSAKAQAGRSIGTNEGSTSARDVRVLAEGTGISLAGKLAGRGLHFLGQIVLARLLGPAAFGLYAIGWTLFRLSSVIGTLGLDRGVIRYATRHRIKDSARFEGVLAQSLGLAFLSGALVAAVLFSMAPWLAERVFNKPDLTMVIRLFAVGVPLFTGLKVAASATRITQRMLYSVIAVDIVQPVSALVLIVIFYTLGWRLIALVGAAVVSVAIALVVGLYYVKQLFPQAFRLRTGSASVARDLVVFSLSASFTATMPVWFIWTDRLMVGYFLPATDVGVFQAVTQLAILFIPIVGACDAIFSPMIADLQYKGEKERLGELYKVRTKWGYYLGAPLFLGIFYAPQEIMQLVFGNGYKGGYSTLLVLVVGQLPFVVAGAVALLLIMTGHQKRWFLVSIGMLFVNIVLDWLLIPRFGTIGAALSTACVMIGLFVFGLFQVRLTLRLWPYDRRHVKGFVATLLAVGALFVLKKAQISSPGMDVVLGFVVSTGTLGAGLYLLGLDAEDRHVVRSLLARLRRGRAG